MGERLRPRPSDWTFGADIDAVHRDIFRADRSREARRARLHAWLGTYQPCVFGRLASRHDGEGVRGLHVEVCVVDEQDLAAGPTAVADRVGRARRAWKDRALAGLSSGFLIWFVDEELARAAPSSALSLVTRTLAGLSLPEHAPVREDVVYTEAVPLMLPADGVGLFKASIQLFSSAAHLHVDHDRRFPGGVAFVINAPGHYARSAALRGLFADHDRALTFVRRTAARSVGNGGIGHPQGRGSSWHRGGHRTATRPARGESSASQSWLFSATHQVDVLVSRRLMTTNEVEAETWDGLHLDYLSDREVDEQDPDFGWFRPKTVPWPERYSVPWLPQDAVNSATFNY